MNPDGVLFVIDPVAATLLALYVLAILVVISFDNVRVRYVRRREKK